MNINSFIKITSFVIMVISYSHSVTDTISRVDTTLIRTIDLTHDGVKDSIICLLKGESWKKPFMMNVKIISNGEILFAKIYNNDFFDSDFGQGEVLGWCDKGYLPCKEMWYYEKMWEHMIVSVPLKNDTRKRLFDSTSNTSIAYTIEELYRDSLNYSRRKARAEAKIFSDNLKKRKFACIGFPIHPYYITFPQIYVPLLRQFITLYGF